MFKFYNFFKSQAGRNNSGAVTVRHRSRPYIQKTYYNYFNAKHSEFKHFQPIKANTFFSIFSRYSGSRLYSFSISRQQSRPLPLYSFRPGSFVNNVESRPGSGSKFARATYSKAIIIRRVGTNSILKLPSGEIRKFRTVCAAYSSLNDSFVKKSFVLGSAGMSRRLGIRPHVRGCAMNPVDHPHGGRTGESRPSVSPWGKLTKGYRTASAKRKKNNTNIILSVQSLKDRTKNPQKL